MSVSYNIDIDTEQSSEIEGNMSILFDFFSFTQNNCSFEMAIAKSPLEKEWKQ